MVVNLLKGIVRVNGFCTSHIIEEWKQNLSIFVTYTYFLMCIKNLTLKLLHCKRKGSNRNIMVHLV